MKLLFLAPQPFFQERGTPIAVRLALRVLADRAARLASQRKAQEIDLLTYHEGKDIVLPGVQIRRIAIPRLLRRFLSGIGPGISLKKLVCDFIFTVTALRLAWRNRHAPYVLVHAVEEAVFVALLIKWLFGVPYVYDMDSSLAMQVSEKWIVLKPFAPLLRLLERVAIRSSVAVCPVCDALGAIASRSGAPHLVVLRDVSLLQAGDIQCPSPLREELRLGGEQAIALYIGNLERYQGMDLVLAAAATLARADYTIVVIGGATAHIETYRRRAMKLGIAERVQFIGPRPVELLDFYVQQADILLSPRIRGNNTPMKIFSYLHSGRAILATALPTHTQVLTEDVAELAAAEPAAFGGGLARLLDDAERRATLGRAGRALAERRYTFERFEEQLNYLYDHVDRIVKVPVDPRGRPPGTFKSGNSESAD